MKHHTEDAAARCKHCASVEIEIAEGFVFCHTCRAVEDSAVYVPKLDQLDEMLAYFTDAPMGEETVQTTRKAA